MGIDHLIRTDYRAVEKNAELRNVIGWLSGDVEKPPILMDDGRPVGIVNDRSLMRRRLDWKSKVHKHLTATKALSPDIGADDAMRRMHEFRASYLPVADEKGAPKGYLRAVDLAREMDGDWNAASLCVNVTRLQPTATMGEALHAFGKEYVDVLPVVNGDGKVRGVIRRRTLVQLEAGRGHGRGRYDADPERPDPLAGEVDGFIDAATATLKPDASRDEVLETLQKFGYAVVQDGRDQFVGIITPATLFENRT